MFTKSLSFIFIASTFVFLSGCTQASKKGSKPEAKSATATTPAAKADKKETAEEAQSRVVCKNGSDERAIQVVKAAEKSASGRICEVVYAKFSKSDVVAGSTNSHAYCEGVQNKIRKNLEAAGFTCK